MSDLLKNKISGYEVQPPADVWKNIASELNESKTFQPLSEKIYHYEVPPPANSWSNISSLLQKEVKAPVKMGRLFMKLAAAAVLIGLILMSSLYFIHQQTSIGGKNVASLPDQPSPTNIESPSPQDQPLPDRKITSSLPTISFTMNREKPVARNRYPARRRVLTAAAITDHSFALNSETNNIVINSSLIRNESGDVIQDPFIITGGDNDEYISVTGPNGQQTRISAKFANVLLYLNGNEQMKDAEWQKKFQEWRRKIMQTSFIPSSNNFLDILELKDFILKDNQQ